MLKGPIENWYGVLRAPVIIDPPFPGDLQIRVHRESPLYVAISTTHERYCCEFLLDPYIVAAVIARDHVERLLRKLPTPLLDSSDPLTQLLDIGKGATIKESLSTLCLEYPCTYEWIDEKSKK